MMFENVKKGDEVAYHTYVGVNRNDVWLSAVVKRVTPTLVITRDGRFSRKTGHMKGCPWCSYHEILPMTDEYRLKIRKYEHTNTIVATLKNVAELRPEQVTDDMLKSLSKILNEANTGN